MKKQKYQKVERFGFLGLRRRHYLYVLNNGEILSDVEVALPRNTYFDEYYLAFTKGKGIKITRCKITTPDKNRGFHDLTRSAAC